jgi:hypothetical protein
VRACGNHASVEFSFGPDTPHPVLLSWATGGHPDAVDEWLRRRHEAQARGEDPAAADEAALAEARR